MKDHRWDEQVLRFVKKTGEEIKSEAQRLLDEVRDPATQQRVRENLKELGSWVRKAAEDVAVRVENAVRTAETKFARSAGVGRSAPPIRPEPATSPPTEAAAPPTPTAHDTGPTRRPTKRAKNVKTARAAKTIGRKKKT